MDRGQEKGYGKVKVFARSNFKTGDLIQWDGFGNMVHQTKFIEVCDGSRQPCGVAAHDIYAGEKVTYDRYRNTKDILLYLRF